MREIVTLQVGQCGNTLGAAFWELISEEHGLLPTGIYCGENMESQLELVNCMFVPGAMGGGQNFVPRAVMIDLDPMSMDTLRCCPCGQLFRPDNFIFGQKGSGNNYARGYFTDGRELQDPASDAIRLEMERTDWPLGFQMFSALGGGTGSGTSALLLEHIKDEYSKLLIKNYCIIPGGDLCSDAVVEPLNATLGSSSLIKYSDITVCMENECMYEICQKTLKLDSPLYSDLNDIMARVISGLSSTYRFRARRHVPWKSITCFMVPSPKLHFFVPGYAPLNSRGVQAYRNFSTQDITYQMLCGVETAILGPINQRSKCPMGKYLAALALYRGFSVWDEDVTELLHEFQTKNCNQFCDWMPYNFIKGISEVPPKGQKIGATFLANHSGAQRKLWGNVLRKFKGIMKRKAFVHWYFAEGMEEDDFWKAEYELTDLLKEYKSAEEQPPRDWVPMDVEQIYKKCLEEDNPFVTQVVIEPKVIPISHFFC